MELCDKTVCEKTCSDKDRERDALVVHACGDNEWKKFDETEL